MPDFRGWWAAAVIPRRQDIEIERLKIQPREGFRAVQRADQVRRRHRSMASPLEFAGQYLATRYDGRHQARGHNPTSC